METVTRSILNVYVRCRLEWKMISEVPSNPQLNLGCADSVNHVPKALFYEVELDNLKNFMVRLL